MVVLYTGTLEQSELNKLEKHNYLCNVYCCYLLHQIININAGVFVSFIQVNINDVM